MMQRALARKAQTTSAAPALRIGRTDDAFEREADRKAEEVMSSAGPAAHWSFSRVSVEPPLQRKAVGHAPARATKASVDEGLQTSSRPLDAETQGFMESRFGYDFSKVKIHSDEVASRSALSLGARAYTLGESIVFSSGNYSPRSVDGRRLLAHELTHVVQQSGRESMIQRSPLDESNQPAPAGYAKGYQYTVDGRTVTLTEEQYKAEVARETHNMALDFRRVSDLVDVYRDGERDFIKNVHGTHWYSVGSISDVVGGANLPDESIWSRPTPAILTGMTALLHGDLALAGRMLPVAQAALKSSIHEWNTYMNATIEGAGSTVAALETTRDVSFSIAIGTAAVVALPVVAAGAAAAAGGVGATGAAATVLTGVGTLGTITAGGAVVGGAARAGTSAAGQALAGDKVSGSEVWKEAKEGARHGAVDAATAVVTAGASKALGPGKSLATKALKAGASGAAGGGVGSATDATIQGKSPKEIAAATARGAVAGFAGGAVGGAGQHVLGEGAAARVVTGAVGGAAGGGAGALLSDQKGKDALSAVITGGLAGGVAGSAEHPESKAAPSRAPAARAPAPQGSSPEPAAPSPVAEPAPPQAEAQHADAASTAAPQPEARAAEPAKAAPTEPETATSQTPDEPAQAPADKDMQAARANAKAAKKAAARIKREAQRREQENAAPQSSAHRPSPAEAKPVQPRPIEVEYANELQRFSELREWNEQVQELRKTDPAKAAEETASLTRTLEAARRNAAKAAAQPHEPELEFSFGVSEKRRQQIRSGEKDFAIDRPITFDIDEVLPVGGKGIKPQRAYKRAISAEDHQLLDPNTNRASKGTGVDPRELPGNRAPKKPVSVSQDPHALLTRRFSEVRELRRIFDRAAQKYSGRRDLSPTELKAAINKETRRIITEEPGHDAEAVRKALDEIGFEHVPGLGWALRKGSASQRVLVTPPPQ
jgi:hypothetical protein